MAFKTKRPSSSSITGNSLTSMPGVSRVPGVNHAMPGAMPMPRITPAASVRPVAKPIGSKSQKPKY